MMTEWDDVGPPSKAERKKEKRAGRRAKQLGRMAEKAEDEAKFFWQCVRNLMNRDHLSTINNPPPRVDGANKVTKT